MKVTLQLIAALLAATTGAAQARPHVPLVQGLTVVEAWRGDSTQGDYESSIRVDEVNAQDVTLILTARSLNLSIDTKMPRATMRYARTYRQVWTSMDPEMITGATSMTLSSALLNELATKGATTMTIIPTVGSGRGSTLDQMGMLEKVVMSDNTAAGTPYSGTLRRVEPHDVPFALLINGMPSSIPAIHVRGEVVAQNDSMNVELYVLDDPLLPIVLEGDAVGRNGGRVIKITYPDPEAASALEHALANKQPAEVYDIYFDYNEATITPASNVALRNIADILKRHPDWRLDVSGHTDNIGGTGPANAALSAKRAAAVANALTSQYGVAANKLSSRGVGSGQPIAPNTTLEGRAKNRRVELRRL